MTTPTLIEAARAALDALGSLIDAQNGPPLIGQADEWDCAMYEANAAIDALRAAIDMISIDRQSFLDLDMRPDGSIHAGYEPILHKYDGMLAKLHAALVAADHDAVRVMQTAVEKGHNYALVVDRLE